MAPLYTQFEVHIAAPPRAVWATLVDPALTRQYMFGCEALSDWKVGSRLDWKGSYQGKDMVFVTGTVVTFQPERLLEYTTFDPNGGLEDVPGNHVTMSCKLTPEDGGTLLELRQGDFSTVQNGQKRFADASTPSDFLQKLKATAESHAGK